MSRSDSKVEFTFAVGRKTVLVTPRDVATLAEAEILDGGSCTVITLHTGERIGVRGTAVDVAEKLGIAVTP
jgi:hypothetical protein